jgi:hypothetical protein
MEDCKPCATRCMPKKMIDAASTDMSYITFHSARRLAVFSISQLTLVPTSQSRLECWAATWLHQVLRMLSLSSD